MADPPAAAGPQPRVRALGYVSVPDDRPLEAEAGLQSRAIEAVCAAREWAFIGGVREAEPAHGKGLERPGLTHALERLEGGEADCLVVTELARLTRSAAEIGELLDRLGRARVRLVVLDLEIDTHTDSGQLVAQALATVSAWEHQRLSERTRKGLAAARQKGTTGRPAVSDRPELVQRITTMRASGMTLQAIADTLNTQGEPTVRGGARWRPSSVQAALGYKRRPKTPNATRPHEPAKRKKGPLTPPPNHPHPNTPAGTPARRGPPSQTTALDRSSEAGDGTPRPGRGRGKDRDVSMARKEPVRE